jgi:GDPmannose 4,6-dehydratase
MFSSTAIKRPVIAGHNEPCLTQLLIVKDYVKGLWRILQTEKPDTYVLTNNQTGTVRDYLNMAAKACNFELTWQGVGESEIGLGTKINKTLVRFNPKLYHPVDVELLISNPEKARLKLGWEPKSTFVQIYRMLIDDDNRPNKSFVSF